MRDPALSVLLERVLEDVEDLLQTECRERLRPYFHRARGSLLGKDVLVVSLPESHEQSIIVRIEETVARALEAVVVGGTATDGLQKRRLVIAVEMYFVGDAIGGVAGFELVDDVRLARD